MGIITLFFTAIGLAMDAFSVSIANGMLIKKSRLFQSFRIGMTFGIFQAIMPIIGYHGGKNFAQYIDSYDHWIAFILLSIIGGKMIYEAFNIKQEEEKQPDILRNWPLIILAIATSIDALAVGLSFAFLGEGIIIPALMIGIVTFICCAIGVYHGKKLGVYFEEKAEIIGGIILILIGSKILIQHLFF